MTGVDHVIEADDQARAWLDAHPSDKPRVIAYEVRRCCGGGRMCSVSVRELSKRDHVENYTPGTLADGTTVLIDRRASRKLPRRFGLTLRGLARWKHLDLVLSGDQWGDLLYR